MLLHKNGIGLLININFLSSLTRSFTTVEAAEEEDPVAALEEAQVAAAAAVVEEAQVAAAVAAGVEVQVEEAAEAAGTLVSREHDCYQNLNESQTLTFLVRFHP